MTRLHSKKTQVLALALLTVSFTSLHILLSSSIHAWESVLPTWAEVIVRVCAALAGVATIVAGCWWVLQWGMETALPTKDNFYRWMRLLALGMLVLLIAPTELSQSLGGGLYTLLLGAAELLCAGFAFGILLRMFWNYRTTRTILLLRSSSMVIGGVVVMQWIDTWLDLRVGVVIYLFAGLTLGVFTILLSRRRGWLRGLSRRERWGYIWWGIVTVIGAIMHAVQLFDSTSDMTRILQSWMVGIQYVVGYVFLSVVIYTILVLNTVFSSGSSADHVTFQFDTLTFFSRIAAEHHEPQQLYDTITAVALGLTQGTSACLLLHDQGRLTIVSSLGIEPSHITALGLDPEAIFRWENGPLVVPSLGDDDYYQHVARSVESVVQSLIVIPLKDGQNHLGVLVVASNRAYAFEYSDAESVVAFTPSIVLALANQRLMQQSLEHERLQRELLIGREMQQRLLPKSIPSLNGWEVEGWSQPAFEVGGDYFDYFWLGNGHACVIIADVSGKGISAAFYMAKLKGVCTALAPLSTGLREFVVQVHRALEHVLERHVFITLAAVGISPDGSIRIVRAGHLPPLAVYTDGQTKLHQPPGIGIGLVSTEHFASVVCEEVLSPTLCQIVLYTDGITELGFQRGSVFYPRDIRVFERLCTPDISLGKQLERVRDYVNTTLEGVHPHDDITIVLLRRPNHV